MNMMNNVIVQLKKTHINAQLPRFNIVDPLTGDTGADVFAVEDTTITANSSTIVNIGLALAFISPGFWFRIYPRSGLGFKYSLQPHLGTIDSQYRGDLAVKMYSFSNTDYLVKSGDKIAQLAFYQLIQPSFEFTETVTESARGEKGFGSSGR